MSKSARTNFKQQVEMHLRSALKEIGPIEPWFDDEIQEWVFEHPLYPESYGGATKDEVIERYPLYLHQLIEHRLKGELAPWVESKTIGRGGRRPGAGRPKGTTKEPTCSVRLPVDVVTWIKSDPQHLHQVRQLMSGRTHDEVTI